jgi:hypothetical protein
MIVPDTPNRTTTVCVALLCEVSTLGERCELLPNAN